MHLQAVLSDTHTRPLFEAAARHGALPVAWLRGVHELARGGDVLVVVHDLSPDPERTLDALQALARGGPTAIFLLLPPSGAVLRAAVGRAARLPLVGVEIAVPELTPSALAQRVRAALDATLPGMAVWARVEAWPLPHGLRDLARAVLVGPRPGVRIARIARGAGVCYEGARRAARRCGMPTPGGMAETLRLLCAAVLLAGGSRVEAAATAQGFRDGEHLRARLRRRLRVTPSQAREIGWEPLLSAVERAWFGPVEAVG